MSKFSGSGSGSREYFHKRKQLAKHATMKDDIYRKKYDNMLSQGIKLPPWVLLTIYLVTVIVAIALFSGFFLS